MERNKIWVILGIAFSKFLLTFAAETCMYTNGLRIRIAVYVYCEDGYFCCENNTQYLCLTGDKCQFTGYLWHTALYTYCDEGYTCCDNNTECCADDQLSTPVIVGIVLGALVVVAVIGGVIAGVWYKYNRPSGRVQTINVRSNSMDEEAQPGTSFEMPPPYEQPGYEPPSYSGTANVTTTVTGINAMVSDDPIPGYKQ